MNDFMNETDKDTKTLALARLATEIERRARLKVSQAAAKVRAAAAEAMGDLEVHDIHWSVLVAGLEDGNVASLGQRDRIVRKVVERMTDQIAARLLDEQKQDDENLCPHGNPLGDCNDCDVAGDFAFDAAREDRMFGR